MIKYNERQLRPANKHTTLQKKKKKEKDTTTQTRKIIM